MGMFDNLKKATADSFTEDIQMIDIENLVSSNDNFFEVNRVEELAETILGQGGVKENLIVKQLDNGKYEIISGHRRTSAVRYLMKQGETVSRFLPCLIERYTDDDDKKLNLVLMNVSARVINDKELWKSYEVVNEILQRKKALGEKFGRIQEKLSEILGVSKGQISKIQNIDKNAIPEIKLAVESGELSINTADKVSKLDIEKQKEVIETTPFSDISATEIAKTGECTTNGTNSNNTQKGDITDDGGLSDFKTDYPKEEKTVSPAADTKNITNKDNGYYSFDITDLGSFSLSPTSLKILKNKNIAKANLHCMRKKFTKTKELELLQILDDLLK